MAATIPLSAAGRQPLFFFGTLMDLDVLAYLLERPVDLDDLRPATITGFRRVRALGASYPVLVPRARMAWSRAGCCAGPPRATSRGSITMRAASIWPSCATSSPTMARGCGLALSRASIICAASDEPWSLADWQRRDKAGFFAACDGWMADFRGDA